ncbi:acyltransferase family protein [Mesorhizobium calcicola]|uniref:Acyltransferase family protein n=1 Tax=Mesorhizobium calcicola TaxID=1300310 RepID=A0ABW4WKG1_9HYPH
MATQRISALDGLRGYAAVVVLICHATAGYNWDLTKFLATPVQSVPRDLIWSKFWLTALNGESAVIIFFLLSGCVLTKSAANDAGRFGAFRSFIAFSVRRVLRIFPAVIVCVLACAAAMGALKFLGLSARALDAHAVLNNLFLLGNDIIRPTWTLQVEIAAVPLIFLGGWAVARLGYIGSVLFLVASLVAHELPWLVLNYSPLSQFLLYLALGAVVPTEIGAGSSRMAERIGWPALLLGFIFIRMFLPFGPIGMLLQAAFGYLFLCLLMYVKPAKITAFLNNPASQFLGKMSFGFYLWNVFFLILLWGFRDDYYPSFLKDYAVEFGLVTGIALAFPSLAMAALSEKYIERPFITLGRTISDRIFNRAAIVAPAKISTPVPTTEIA